MSAAALVLGFVGQIFKPVVDLIDELHTSEEEKMAAKQKLFEAQSAFFDKVLEFETRALEAKARIIEAEAKSEHFVTAAWRPILMLVFGGLVVARWFGLTAANITPEIETQLWTVIQLGIGGYVAGRSVEKVAETVGKVLDKRNQS